MRRAAITGIALGLGARAATAESSGGMNPGAIRGAPATANPSPYSAALTCLSRRGRWIGGAPPRDSGGRISDLKGRGDLHNGPHGSPGAPLVSLTAPARSRAPVGERLDHTPPPDRNNNTG
ncbi:hypothetical protein ER13_16610, partial [Brevundimonas sp. EAKA]